VNGVSLQLRNWRNVKDKWSDIANETNLVHDLSLSVLHQLHL